MRVRTRLPFRRSTRRSLPPALSARDAGGDEIGRSRDYPASAVVAIEVWPPGAGGGETLQRRPYPFRSWSSLRSVCSRSRWRSARGGLGTHSAIPREFELDRTSPTLSV